VRIRSPQGAQPQASFKEFQKQQKTIAELETTVACLVATVKDQAAQIEKVSAQLGIAKACPTNGGEQTVTDRKPHNHLRGICCVAAP
jgi:hypothetical protein